MTRAIQHIAIEADAPVTARVQHLPRPQSLAKLLQSVIRNNDNDDVTGRYYAHDALTDNRAAFWIAREGVHSQIANCVMRTACRLGTLAVALEDEIPSYHRRNFPNAVETILDLLIPLNSAAVVQLMDAYSEAGTFRDRDELIARRDRVSPLVREFA